LRKRRIPPARLIEDFSASKKPVLGPKEKEHNAKTGAAPKPENTHLTTCRDETKLLPKRGCRRKKNRAKGGKQMGLLPFFANTKTIAGMWTTR